MRAFIAIELPDAVTEMLRAVRDELSKKAGKEDGVSWAKPENIHLTLKFLGEIEPSRVEDIYGELKKAAEGIEPFHLSAGGVGGFPGLKSPRVIWVGIKESMELKQLHGNIEERLCRLGFEKEGRPFQPHLTLCRIRSSDAGRAAGKAAMELKEAADIVFKTDSFALFESELNPKGAKYSVLKRVNLAPNT